MNPTFQKKFKVICQDEPYFPKKFQSNLSRGILLLKKISKSFIEGTLPPKKFQSNLSGCTLHPKKIQSNSSVEKKFQIFFLKILLQFLGKPFTYHIFWGTPQYPGRSTFCNITHGSHSTKNLNSCLIFRK